MKYYKDILLVIFLRRPLADSYKSLCKSLTTGNWGTTPEQQLECEKQNRRGWRCTPPSYSNYINDTEDWFLFTKNICQKYNISNTTINFEDVIDSKRIAVKISNLEL